MPRIFTLLIAIITLAACGGSRKFRAPVSEDKPLFAAINELIKRPENAKAQNDLRYFYEQAIGRHEEAVAVYRNSQDPSRWDKLLFELNALQTIYTAVQAVPNGTSFVQPKNYLRELQTTREDAADYYYEEALYNFEQDDRKSSMIAYNLFRKANQYVQGYKDAVPLSKEAYNNSIVNVMVNPVREDFPTFFRDWDEGARYRPDYFQDALVRELGGKTASNYPARFFTDVEASREYVKPDWILNVKWDYINTSTGIPSRSSRQVSQRVQSGKDSTGKPTYETVYGTLTIISRRVDARATLSYSMDESYSNKNIDRGSLTDNVSWTESYATFKGDRRALSDEDRALIRYRNFDRGPSKTEVMEALMRKMFPDLRRRIENAVTP